MVPARSTIADLGPRTVLDDRAVADRQGRAGISQVKPSAVHLTGNSPIGPIPGAHRERLGIDVVTNNTQRALRRAVSRLNLPRGAIVVKKRSPASRTVRHELGTFSTAPTVAALVRQQTGPHGCARGACAPRDA